MVVIVLDSRTVLKPPRDQQEVMPLICADDLHNRLRLFQMSKSLVLYYKTQLVT
jgi:hypothetical protein